MHCVGGRVYTYIMNTSTYPVWTAPVALDHQIANVREMLATGEFVSYAVVVPTNIIQN